MAQQRAVSLVIVLALLGATCAFAFAARSRVPVVQANELQHETAGAQAVFMRQNSAPSRTPTDEVASARVAQPQANTPTRTPTPVNIGNFVWDDLDKNGRQDAGEPGIPNVIVQLWNSTKTQLIDTAVTNANGNYTLTAPQPGNFRIRVLRPSLQDAFSPKDQANDDDSDDSDINQDPTLANFGFTDIIEIASNLISTTVYDAGIIVFRPPTATRTPTPINLGNRVWIDINTNGFQDAGEPGFTNATLQLWNADKTQLLSSTTTDANGNYTLVAPVPGDYYVRVLLPSGANFSPKNQGGDDTKDSDINTSTIGGNRGFTDIITIASNVISITSIDAGLINVPATATPTATATATPIATPTLTPTRTPTPEGFVAPVLIPAVNR